MLQPPTISEDAIVSYLQAEYGVKPVSLAFLPLGADLGTAVYRASGLDGHDLFIKLRFDRFDEMAALVPRWLADRGIPEIIAPLPTKSGCPFVTTKQYTLLVYPFVEGRDAYEVTLTEGQWVAFGRAVRRYHDAPLPVDLAGRLPRETFDARWRDDLRAFVVRRAGLKGLDRVGREYEALLDERRAQVLDLIDRTDHLAQVLRAAGGLPVLCHTDLHPGNLLACPDGRFFIVDWDAPLLAPRERDLMYPGGALGFAGCTSEREEALFYEGYGSIEVDARCLAYYRLERIIEDMAVIGAQLLAPTEDGGPQADREQALKWAMSNFLPGHVLEIADQTYSRLP